MGIKYDGKLKMDLPQAILKNHGFGLGGPIQKFVDSEVIRYCDPKVPFRTGTLKNSALTASSIGQGLVVYATPYAGYLYRGEVYGPNIPIMQNGTLVGFRSPKQKHPTGRELTYNGAPERGAFWFERAMSEHIKDIEQGVQTLAGRLP